MKLQKIHIQPATLCALALSFVMVALTACNVPAVPVTSAQESTPVLKATYTPVEPTPTLWVEATPTPYVPLPTYTAYVQPEPTEPPGEAPVITRDNLSRLFEQTFGLPDWATAFIWPAPEASLPGPVSPWPDLLLQSGSYLHPVLLDPPGLGMPLALPLNGTQPLAFSPNGTSLVIKDPSRTALFQMGGPMMRELPQPANSYIASYSSDGRFLVVTSADTIEAYLYDLSAPIDSAPLRLAGFETAAPIYNIIVAPGGQTIAWVARATLQLQNTATGEMGARFDYPDFISNVAFSPDGSKVAVEMALQLSLYSVSDGAQIAQIPLAYPLSSLTWSPNGQLLAAGALGSLEIFDGSSLIPLISLPGPNSSTTLVAFSPDGRYIVTTHDSMVFGIWRTQ